MVQVSALLALAASVSALPLNINLGAYSPALVVGDGEISFGGQQDVTNLMNALEGAAVSGAAANAAGAPAAAAPQASTAPAAAAPAAPAGEAAPATNAADQTPQITALQGMGKEIAPRVVPLTKDASKLASRDLSGFDRALTYAAAALKTSPEIQLGTGGKGSGVGITQSAGGTTTGTASNTTRAGKRDAETDAEEEGEELDERSFEYDAEGNEIDERSTGEAFTYDAAGNEIEKTKRSFEYDAEGNEIEKRSTGEAFTYDAAGNEVEKTKRSFEYDAEGNEIEERSTGEAFTYDAAGNEIENRKLASKMKTTVTTMYIRGGPSSGVSKAVEGSPVQKRSVQRRASRKQRRAPSAGIDGVNLNVNDGQGVTLTFVETKAADEAE